MRQRRYERDEVVLFGRSECRCKVEECLFVCMEVVCGAGFLPSAFCNSRRSPQFFCCIGVPGLPIDLARSAVCKRGDSVES